MVSKGSVCRYGLIGVAGASGLAGITLVSGLAVFSGVFVLAGAIGVSCLSKTVLFLLRPSVF